MAGVDVVSSPLSSLLEKAKDLCSSLTAMVPAALYLPSPPLYCPQPSPNTQDPAGTFGYHAEMISRHKISQVIQQLLLLLRSAHCCSSAAQWYLSQLRRARHILYKMKKKYSYPNADVEERAFPDGLMKFINRRGHFRSKTDMDSSTVQTLVCFRELCGLCWMLHVRDQLSATCRKYQAEKQHSSDDQISKDSAVRSSCVDALQWAQRLLPFSHFLNCEDILQDTLLSLLSEMPPLSLVADTIVLSFPEEEESIRVSLREKYNTLIQSLRQCNVIDGKETGEMMMVLIQDKLRLRKKHFKRLRRHLVSLELHLWGKENENEDYRSKHGMAMLRQLSMGTSLSTSSITDCGLLPLHSDAETTENTSEAPVPSDLQNRSKSRSKKSEIRDRRDEMKVVQRVDHVDVDIGPSGDAKEKHNGNKTNIKQPALPSVGSWEFELEDEEYLNFLELFLSYLLEKDTADCPGELPLLKGFSNKLREKELHSLTFDVLTTMHRCQRDGHHPDRKNSEPPVFRAGSCFRPMTQDTTQISSSFFSLQNKTSLPSSSQLEMDCNKGLFSHQNRQRKCSQQSLKSAHNHSVTSSFRSDLAAQKSSPCLRCCSVSPVVETKQGIDSKLEAHFPELARLLEWMMRWTDRRLMLGHLGKKRDKGSDAGETVDGGVVIRVKASTPAVLTSLSLMAQRYTTLPGADFYTAHLQIPETQWIVAPAVGRPIERKVERQSCVDKGFMSSANTPTTVESFNLHQKEDSLHSCAGKPESQSLDTSHLIQDQDIPQSETELRAESSQSCAEKSRQSNIREPSPSIPSEICSPDTSLKLAELERSQSQHISATLLSHTSPDVELLNCSSSKPEIASHNVGSNAQSLSQTAEVPPIPPPAADPCTVSFAPDQGPPDQAPPMRQRLGEDLYRLVQNINYISLMEVLGASFSNLQLAQQNASLAQSNLNTQTEVPVLNVHNVMPSPNVPLVTAPLVTHAQRLHPNSPPDCVDQTATATQHRLNMNLQTDAFSSTPILSGHQEMTPLFVHAGSPVRNVRYNVIPVSEGLLTTTEAKQADHRNSGLPASNSCIPNHPAQLKLLQLHPPQLSTFVPRPAAHSYPSHESMPSRCKLGDQPGYTRNAINSASVTQHQPVPVSSNLDQKMFGRFKKEGFSIFPQALPVPQTSTPQGLRLLHVQPVSSINTTFPQLPTKTVSRPSTFMFMPIGETPQIKLLQIEPHPKMMLALQASLSKTAHPIPEKQSDVNTQVQLLIIEKPVDYSNKPTPLQNSRKRQRRREKPGKAEVSFRPSDSIIPQEATSDAEDVPVFEEAIHELDSAIPCGPCTTQGESLVAKAFATAAELHAFASTSKRPPERRDVFTNTDAVSSLHVDKAVSTDNSLKTPLWRKAEAFRNDSFQDQKELELKEDRHVILEGRQFISVMDLEDKSQHQDLPQSPTSLLSVCAEPTVAELHIMATTVFRNDADLQTSFEQMDNMCNDQTSVHSEESVSPDHLVSDSDLAANIGEFGAGICGAVKTQAMSNSSLSQQPTAWFSSQMSQLDSQLTALQRIADSLETDLSKTTMLVNVTEIPTPVSTSDKTKTRSTGVKKTVRLHVPPEINGRTPQHSVSKEERTHEPVNTSTAGLTGIHPPPRRTLDLAELSAISNNLGDVNQEEAELSDTVDILEELVREGLLSQTDLDLSFCARQQQSLTQESNMNMPQSNAVPEEDRRELRIWMRKKERERLSVYQKQRKNLREMEHKPFSSPSAVKSMNKNPKLKAKVERDQVLNNFNQRTLDACNLASDLSACPSVIKGFSDSAETFTPRSFSAIPPDQTYRVGDSSVRDRFPSGLLRPRSAGSKEVPSEGYRQRLGIDRPVTSLPRDRLSQVTRRGMVTNTTSSKSNTRENIESKGSPSRSTAVGGQHQTKMNKLVNASETFRICGGEESSLDVAELDKGSEGQNDAIADGPQWDWLDNLSETGSSNLSKIDWAAIERMVSEDM